MRDDIAVILAMPVAVLAPLGTLAILDPLIDSAPGAGWSALAVLVVIIVIANACVLGGASAGLFATTTALLAYDFVLFPPDGELTWPRGNEWWPLLTILLVGGAITAAARQTSGRRQEPSREVNHPVASGLRSSVRDTTSPADHSPTPTKVTIVRPSASHPLSLELPAVGERPP